MPFRASPDNRKKHVALGDLFDVHSVDIDAERDRVDVHKQETTLNSCCIRSSHPAGVACIVVTSVTNEQFGAAEYNYYDNT